LHLIPDPAFPEHTLMPKPYPPDQKQEALRLLELYNYNVSTVVQLTDISHTTLRRWRDEHFHDNPDLSAKKSFPIAEKLERMTEPSTATKPDNDEPPVIPAGVEVRYDGGQKYYRLPDGRVVNKLPAKSPKRISTDANDDFASYEPHKELPDPDSQAAYWHKDHLLFQLGGGVPGKSYPYPLEEEEESQGDYEEFRNVRDILMQHASRLAVNLRPDDPDINRRSLALSRILDRIAQLDEMLPDLNPEQVIRFEYTYNGSVYNVPPWSDDELKYMNKIKDLEKALAEALNALEATQSAHPSSSDAQQSA
ncbi:MAG: transposase, partial [Anaerolineae bacterium]|nr:transposase [Anaerolineae bacterium]